MEMFTLPQKRSYIRLSRKEKEKSEEIKVENIRVKFVGANSKVKIEGLEESEAKVSYFRGKDPRKWVKGARTYHKVLYRELYPHIDLIVYGKEGRIKHEYQVRVGGEVENIKVIYGGIERLLVNERGQLEIETGEGILREDVSLSYQVVNGKQIEVEAEYVIDEDYDVRLKLGEYRKDEELIIDPGLEYSTYLGGSSFDYAEGIAIDGNRNAYVTGWTGSSDFPTTPSAYDISIDGYADVFITKINASGTDLIYSTFLGGSLGSSPPDCGYAIAVDGNGNAYVAGDTASNDFPTTPGAYDTSYNDWRDAFITKLNSTGTDLIYSTFLGGAKNDICYGITIDVNGNAYVTGDTGSTDFPTTTGVYDTTYNGGDSDVFITKLNSTGSGLVYSTYLGGSTWERGLSIAIDGSGNAYLTGDTTSTDFPAISGAYDTSYNGGEWDAFITKLNSSGSTLLYSTYLGDNSNDCGSGIDIDGNGNAYVTGVTNSTDFPTTPGAYNTTHNGLYDAFITKVNSSGSDLAYSTFLGGELSDDGRGIAVDGRGDAYVIGGTHSITFPTTTDAFDPSFNGSVDAFITRINSTGTALIYSTFLGSNGWDSVSAITIDGSGNAYVTGSTPSTDFPTTTGVYDTTYNGGDSDVFITKLPTSLKKDGLLGTWDGSGVWFRNSVTGSWVKMSTPADLVTAGDLDGDGTDDLIGVWSSGLWVKYSSSGSWARLTTLLPSHIASGDMNGDGRDDVLGTWASGVWYKDSVSGTWVKMCSVPAYLITAGEIDGDGTDDLVGTWSSGLWVKYSETGTWGKICTPLPSDIDAGLFRSGWGAGAMNFEGPIGGVYVEGPDSIDDYLDLSGEGPGGWNFAFQVEENLVPQEKGLKIMMRIPGPGEPGFKYIEQKNLVPLEKPESKKKRRK